MRQTLEDYCHEVDKKAERFAREEVTCRQSEHLRAFNFGRTIQRVENSRRDAWLRVGFLLAGLVIGVACGRAYPDHLSSTLAHRLLTKANLIVRKAENSTPWRIWTAPHP